MCTYEPENSALNFDAWKKRLRDDCLALGKLEAFHSLPEIVLRMFHESGLDPSVEAILKNGLNDTKVQ